MKDTDRGLDLTRVGATTAQEKAEFQKFYAKNLGRSHPGLDFWLEPAPDVLKRYRAFATALNPGGLEGAKLFVGFAFLPSYALSGYTEGVRYIVRLWQEQRLTKAQVLEGLAIGFIHIGPRGMETVADALDGYEWITPTEPPRFPDGWAHDPDAFRSGLDFSRTELTRTEAEALRAWYVRTLGEVPRYVTFLLRYRPEALKAFRARYETAIETLPKQVMPYTLLHWSVIRGSGDGIRENVLLARAFGMTKDWTMRAIASALLNAGVETVSLVDRVAGDVFRAWDRTASGAHIKGSG
jgi:hypothetical protein